MKNASQHVFVVFWSPLPLPLTSPPHLCNHPPPEHEEHVLSHVFRVLEPFLNPSTLLLLQPNWRTCSGETPPPEQKTHVVTRVSCVMEVGFPSFTIPPALPVTPAAAKACPYGCAFVPSNLLHTPRTSKRAWGLVSTFGGDLICSPSGQD